MSVRDTLTDSKLSKYFSGLTEAAEHHVSQVDALWAGRVCRLNGDVCDFHKDTVESVETEFYSTLNNGFTKFFKDEVVDMYNHTAGRTDLTLSATRFDNFYCAKQAFEDLEARLKANARGATVRGNKLLAPARRARDMADILNELSKQNIIDKDLLVEIGRHYNTMRQHYENVLLDKKTVVHRNNNFPSRAVGAQLAAFAFEGAFLAHDWHVPTYETLRNAVASLPGVKNLNAPLAIPAEIFLLAGMQLFAVKSAYDYLSVEKARANIKRQKQLNLWDAFAARVNGENINEFSSCWAGNVYVRVKLPKELDADARTLEFRIKKSRLWNRMDKVIVRDGMYVPLSAEEIHKMTIIYDDVVRWYNKAHPENAKRDFQDSLKKKSSSEQLNPVPVPPPAQDADLTNRSRGKDSEAVMDRIVKNSFNGKIATYVLPNSEFIRYRMGRLGGLTIIENSGDVDTNPLKRELQEFYLSAQKNAKLASKAASRPLPVPPQSYAITPPSPPLAPMVIATEQPNWDKKLNGLDIVAEAVELKWNKKLKLI